MGRLLGISIQLHFSWFIIFALVTYSLAFSLHDDGRSIAASVTIGIFTSILLFASVLAHELAHSVVAVRNGIPVRSITLFILGGVAQIGREAPRPKVELLVALAGPICSLALAGIFGVAWFVGWGRSQDTLDFGNPIFWLAWINLILAIFNMVPGFPLDGGRILRAILWHSTGNYRKASRIASAMGRGVAYALIVGGLGIVIGSGFTEGLNAFNGLWLAIIGWFLHQAAVASYRQVEMHEALRGYTAQSVMHTSYTSVSPDLSLAALVQDYVLSTGGRLFVVAQGGRLLGIVVSDSIKSVPRDKWDYTPVRQIMVPADKVVSAEPEEEALSVLERMNEHDLDQMLVIKNGLVIGIILRHNLLHIVRLRSQLQD